VASLFNNKILEIMKNLIKDKQVAKIALQITILSASLMLASFLTETQWWLDWFNSKYVGDDCGGSYGCKKEAVEHYHWNYRGWIYFLTGIAYFVLSVVKIVRTHLPNHSVDKQEAIRNYDIRSNIVNRMIELEAKDRRWSSDEEELKDLRDKLFKIDGHE